MKKNEIIKCLKANKKISGYELTIINKDSRELFYVLNHLEINRAVKTNKTSIKVFAIDEKSTGTSTIAVTSQDNQTTLTKKINDAYSKAKVAKNEYYPIASNQDSVIEKKPREINLNNVASSIAEAVLKADVYEDGWINSTEIFVTNIEREYINSNGVKHLEYTFRIEIECIPTWSNKKEEFELYKFYQSNKIDYKQITSEVNEILNLAKARSIAKKIKDVKIPKDVLVLVKNDMRDTIVDNIISDLSFRELYMHQNHYFIKDKISNNQFDLTMKPEIQGCVDSSKFDASGIKLKTKKIVSKGVVSSNFGGLQFGTYLKRKDIVGSLRVSELKAQGIDYSKKKHIIIETFSSPQLEATSGYWGGEVRLARYFDGKKYIPLTGFSISGSIYEDLMNVEFSKEIDYSDSYKGPKYFIFKGLKIS